ncbi:unnamed protein product [Choristocarpus tenellus]
MARKRKRPRSCVHESTPADTRRQQGDFAVKKEKVKGKDAGKDGKGEDEPAAISHNQGQTEKRDFLREALDPSDCASDTGLNDMAALGIPWALPEEQELPAVASAWGQGEEDDDVDEGTEEDEEGGEVIGSTMAINNGYSEDGSVLKSVGVVRGASCGKGNQENKSVDRRRSHQGGSQSSDSWQGTPLGKRLQANGSRIQGKGGVEVAPISPHVESSLPRTVFASQPGKVCRVGKTKALVVGLCDHEKLCFIGAVRVRSGLGQASIAGHTLLPVPRGPYVEAHSTSWLGLLVLKTLQDNDEEAVPAKVLGSILGLTGPAREKNVFCEENDGEEDVEAAVDTVAKTFPFVVIFRPLQHGPLMFLSSQSDADTLYTPIDTEVDGVGISHASTALLHEGSLPSEIAACMHLPGFQVIVDGAITPRFNTSGVLPLSTPRAWVKTATTAVNDSLSQPQGTSVLVCGAKGVGKSTLCRYLINRLLSRHPKVAYLDCDPGQPEFTPPGMVSFHLLESPVFGPSHTALRRPELGYFIGATSPKPCPLLFSAAVRALVDHAKACSQSAGLKTTLPTHEVEGLEDDTVRFEGALAYCSSSPIPLVINTDGWVKGLGEDLLQAVVDISQPSHIVQILGTATSKKFTIKSWPPGCCVYPLRLWEPPKHSGPGRVCLPNRPNSLVLRTLRLIAYFLGEFKEEDRGATAGGQQRSLATGQCNQQDPSKFEGLGLKGGALFDPGHQVAALLAAKVPRMLPWATIRICIASGPIPPDMVLHAINGAVVGLLAVGEGEGFSGGTPEVSEEGWSNPVCLAEAPLAPCVGLGLVRSIDPVRQLLYLLSPEPLSSLRRVNVLVKGSLHLPAEMLYDSGSCSHPYFSSEVVGGKPIKGQGYLLRRGKH